jgi:mRNA-degrading endonuclease RelE of RelBE toxin-antitoxin system
MAGVNVAKTFMKSASNLSGQDRARVFDFLNKFLSDPANPGLSTERVQGARDPNIWSARMTGGLRTIYHHLGDAFTLLYAGQHDESYDWAARRKLEHHPVTGTLQIVEMAESVQDALPHPTRPADAPRLFARQSEDYLLSLGVPVDWLPTIREIADEDQLLMVADKLPEEVAERLLRLAGGELVTPPVPVPLVQPISASPDNLRRFYVVQEASELCDLLQKPFEDWLRFLHPSQRELATGTFKGPVKVTGSAGTGKTVVAMHRARYLADQGQRVLLTSFVTTLCKNIEHNLQILCTDSQRELVTVGTVHSQALRLAREVDSQLAPADEERIAKLIERFQDFGGAQFDRDFLLAEWTGVVENQGILSWDEYRDAQRIGRGRALQVRERLAIWKVFQQVYEDLADKRMAPWTLICRTAAEAIQTGRVQSPFDAVVIDEVQDLKPQEIRFLAVLAGKNPGNLMLIGDAGQRIYPGGYSLRSLGIDVRGRSRVLRINYRTTEQIRRFADRILPESLDDLDGGTETRKETRSLLRGPMPTLHGFTTGSQQDAFVVDQVQRLLGQGLQPREIAVFARVGSHLESIQRTLDAAGIAAQLLSRDDDSDQPDGIRLGTMHRAKGLEFKVVFAYDCSEGIVPHMATLRRYKDPADYDAARAREQQLLYVTLTRARDEAFITWAGLPSPFLPDKP